MCSARLPATPRSSWPTRRWPGDIPAVPTLITELGVSGVLFTADAALPEGQLHTGRRNGLLVQVKQNQPILHETLARLCAEHRPFDSHETVDRRRHGRQEHRLVEVFDTAGQLDAEWQPPISSRDGHRPDRVSFSKVRRETRTTQAISGCPSASS